MSFLICVLHVITVQCLQAGVALLQSLQLIIYHLQMIEIMVDMTIIVFRLKYNTVSKIVY